MERLGPTSHTYTSQRLRLHYVDWGNPDAPPLILLHGGRDHCRSWDWVAEELRNDWHIIAPDLRGHGDSEWTSDGNYEMLPYVYDLAQLIDQLALAPVNIVAHSLGGNIALRYTGLFPDKVANLVAIEGLGPSPDMQAERERTGTAQRLRDWIGEKRKAAAYQQKRYNTFEDALTRMQEANQHLSAEQVQHLTVHAVSRNEDGSYSWKFDPHVHAWSPVDMALADLETLWGEIRCPTLLVYGEDSWASNPDNDGRVRHFNTADVVSFATAGHWVHHDQFAMFVDAVREFL